MTKTNFVLITFLQIRSDDVVSEVYLTILGSQAPVDPIRLFNILRGFLACHFPLDDFPYNRNFKIHGMVTSGCLHYRVPPIEVGSRIVIPQDMDVQTIVFEGKRGEPFTWLTFQTYVITTYRQFFGRAKNCIYPPVYEEKVSYDSCPTIKQERVLCPCPLPFPICQGVVKFEDNPPCNHY